MSEVVDLTGMRVELGEPRAVDAGVGHCWFPDLVEFPDGKLLLTHSLVADALNLVGGQTIMVSGDRGRTWELSYDVAQAAAVKLGLPDGAIAGPSYYLYPDPPGQGRRFVGHFMRIEDGGRSYRFLPWGARVDGLPRDARPMKTAGGWRGPVPAEALFCGDAVGVPGGILTTIYLTYAGDHRYSTVAVVSSDGGRTWTYRSTVASPEDTPGAREGPCEPTICRLAGGELVCIMRTGSGRDQPLIRVSSGDDGRTWTKPERLPAFSVMPCVRRLQNGALVLSTGRPGVFLWLSTDERRAEWQAVDLVAHHNRWAPDPGHAIQPEPSTDRARRHAGDQTTAYTAMVEIAPNRLLLVYDRIPFGWSPVPAESPERSRIYILEIGVELR